MKPLTIQEVLDKQQRPSINSAGIACTVALVVVIVLFFASLGHSQELMPHPFVAGGIQMSNSGVQTVAGVGSVGLTWHPKCLFFEATGDYIAARKSNDNTIGNDSGHTRRLEGVVLYPVGRWAFGGGYSYSKLDTTNYSKSSGHPEVGGAFEWKRKPVRLQMLYVLPGSDWQNGVQGVKSVLFVPLTKHIFTRIEGGGYRSYSTVTDPADASTTAMEKSHHDMFTVVRLQMGVRF